MVSRQATIPIWGKRDFSIRIYPHTLSKVVVIFYPQRLCLENLSFMLFKENHQHDKWIFNGSSTDNFVNQGGHTY